LLSLTEAASGFQIYITSPSVLPARMEILTEISWLITGLPFKSRATAWYLKAWGVCPKAKMLIRAKARRRKVFFIIRFFEIIEC